MRNDFSAMRVVYLPPMTVAVIKNTSASPEFDTLISVDNFIRQNDLINKKPDFRHFGFSPKMPFDNNVGTYERWISIPDDIGSSPLYVKRQFTGGMYAALATSLENFDSAAREIRNILNESLYTPVQNEEHIFLEEYLNVWLLVNLGHDKYYNQAQIDLLVKVKMR